MTLILSGTDGLSDIDGSAATPAIRGTDANTGIYFPGADRIGFAEGGVQCGEFDASGNFLFNSGYGSAAIAYGCRAWVNFNGASTVSIRASGNVSTITDNGVGNYTVNFSTSLPDASYVTNVTDGGVSIGNKGGAQVVSANQNVGNVQVSTYTSSTSSYDSTLVGVSVFR